MHLVDFNLQLLHKMIELKQKMESSDTGWAGSIFNEFNSSKEAVKDYINEWEKENGVKFVTYTKDKNYGNTDWKPSAKERIYWEHPLPNGSVSIPFDGFPFMFVGRKVLLCQFGKDMEKDRRDKRYNELERLRSVNPENYPKKRRRKQSIKIGCPATVNLVQIAKFQSYKYHVAKNSKRQRRTAADKLRQDLLNGAEVDVKMMFIKKASALSEHEGHLVCVENTLASARIQGDRNILAFDCLQETDEMEDLIKEIYDEKYLTELLIELRRFKTCIKSFVHNAPILQHDQSDRKRKLPMELLDKIMKYPRFSPPDRDLINNPGVFGQDFVVPDPPEDVKPTTTVFVTMDPSNGDSRTSEQLPTKDVSSDEEDSIPDDNAPLDQSALDYAQFDQSPFPDAPFGSQSPLKDNSDDNSDLEPEALSHINSVDQISDVCGVGAVIVDVDNVV
ncbi:uncharacterized protein LOC100177484 [Ciona intestinalis]